MELDYNIAYSQRKKLLITVERDCSILVRAPVGTPEAQIRKLVDSKRQWIFGKIHHPQKYAALPHPPGKELVNGESMLYLGRHYQVEMVDSERQDIQFTQRFLVPKHMKPQGINCFREWYKQRANEKLLPRIQHYAKALGVTYQGAKITESRYQWGSCTPANNLNINWKLIKAPMFVIDYVIVHELAHLLEANHTPRFWGIVKAQLPHMEKAKNWLREHGQVLEEEL